MDEEMIQKESEEEIGDEGEELPVHLGGKRVVKAGCSRCGECCTSGTPVLLRDDLQLFRSGVLSHETVYAVREGERQRSPQDGEFYESPLELLRVREQKDTNVCTFFGGDEGCGIYETRPLQCRRFACWRPGDVKPGLQEERLSRSDLFGDVEFLMQVMARHEEKCSYRKFADAVERATGGDEDAAEEVLDILRYDTHMRSYLKEKFSLSDNAVDLILGRALTDTVVGFGLQVRQEGDEYVVTPLEKAKPDCETEKTCTIEMDCHNCQKREDA
ncbi:MAG TPA: YkgJ family cysteine cluster protein [Dissulfurispiraceae bacterium]|nr:YkgJ family cysteine cluster protein [Dissulfurispiraceae bacterium]